MTARERDTWTEAGRDEDKGKSRPYISLFRKTWADNIAGSTNSEYINSSAPESKVLTVTAGTSDVGVETVPLDIQPLPQRRALRLSCFSVSVTQSRELYGREDILQLLDKTLFDVLYDSFSAITEAKTFAICGPGGIGKTGIATQFAYTRRRRFDAIFWIRADSAIKIRNQLSRVAFELGLVDDGSVDARDQVILIDLVKGWLATPHRDVETPDDIKNQASWLIILDNVDDLSVLKDIWPLQGPGCVIFTSRDPLVKDLHFLAANGVNPQPFNKEDSYKFLEILTEKRGDSRGVHE